MRPAAGSSRIPRKSPPGIPDPYREWLRTQPCAARTSRHHRCYGHVDPAEVLDRTGGTVPVPLCQNAMSEKTARGVRAFAANHRLDLPAIAEALYDQYVEARVQSGVVCNGQKRK
jgi:hypothetical protein